MLLAVLERWALAAAPSQQHHRGPVVQPQAPQPLHLPLVPLAAWHLLPAVQQQQQVPLQRQLLQLRLLPLLLLVQQRHPPQHGGPAALGPLGPAVPRAAAGACLAAARLSAPAVVLRLVLLPAARLLPPAVQVAVRLRLSAARLAPPAQPPQAAHLVVASASALVPAPRQQAAQQQGLGSRLPLGPLQQAQGLVLPRRLEARSAHLQQAAAGQAAAAAAAVFLVPALAVPHPLGSNRVAQAARRHLGLPLGRRPPLLLQGSARQRLLLQRQPLGSPQGLDRPRVSAKCLALGNLLLLGSLQPLVRHLPLGRLHHPLVGQRLQLLRLHSARQPRQHQALASRAPLVVARLLLAGLVVLALLPPNPRQQEGLALLRLLVGVGPTTPLVRWQRLAALQHLEVVALGLVRLAVASHNSSSSSKDRAACGRCGAECGHVCLLILMTQGLFSAARVTAVKCMLHCAEVFSSAQDRQHLGQRQCGKCSSHEAHLQP